LAFVYIPVEVAKEQGGAAFETMNKTEKSIPATAE